MKGLVRPALAANVLLAPATTPTPAGTEGAEALCAKGIVNA